MKKLWAVVVLVLMLAGCSGGSGGVAGGGKSADLVSHNTTTGMAPMWVNGTPNFQHWSIYGTKGVASLVNTPGARWGAVSWTDLNGNLWLFGERATTYPRAPLEC